MTKLLRILKSLRLTNLAHLLDEQACRPYKKQFANLIFQSKYDA